MGDFLNRGPTGGTREGKLLCRGLWQKGEILIYQEALFIGESTRFEKKKKLWKRASLSIGAPLGNLEEGSSNRDFDRQ